MDHHHHHHQNPAKKSPKMSSPSTLTLTSLPPNLLVEILSRLPLKSLLTIRTLSKTLLNFSNPNPHFTSLHSLFSPQSLVLQLGDPFAPSTILHFIDPEFDLPRLPHYCLKPIFQVPKIQTSSCNIYRTNFRYRNEFSVVNSCNGLVYLAKRRSLNECSVICNPVTNEYVLVVKVDSRDEPLSETRMMMLGYSNDKYKVVRIYYTSIEGCLEVRAQVHVVGSSLWRDIDDKPLGLDYSFDACLVYLNGVTYWLSCVEEFVSVVSFDFEKEVFGNILLPSEFGKEQLKNTYGLGIGVLGGHVCVTNNVYNRHLDIWFMKRGDNGEECCWSKEFVIDTVRPIGSRFYGQLRPLQVLGNGEILMLWLENDLVCYDPRKKSLKCARFSWPTLPSMVVGFTPSFVPLKDALSVNNVVVQCRRPSGDRPDL